MKMKKYQNICSKLLLGTLLIAMSLAFDSTNNDLNAVISGNSFVTADNKFCGAKSMGQTPLKTENDKCIYDHYTSYTNNSSMASEMGPIKVTNYKLTANGSTITGPVNSTSGNLRYDNKTLGYGRATSPLNMVQTGTVSAGTGITPDVKINKTTQFNMSLDPIKPTCTTTINQKLSNLNGVYYLGSGTGTIRWDVQGAKCSANGGSSCDSLKNKGQADNVATQAVSSVVNSYGMIKKGTKTNLYNWNLFGFKEQCTTEYAYCIDDQKPNCNLKLSTTAWTNGTVSVTRTCSDGGCAGCSTGNSTWVHSTNGKKGGYACKDNAGNDAGLKYIIISNIDKLAPVCGTVTATNGNYYYNTAYQVKVPCSDKAATADYGKSGCKKDTYTALTSNGNYNVTIYDVAGNSTACKGTVNLVDTGKPTVTITLEEGQSLNSNTHYTSNATVTATITAKDTGNAGIKKVCYTLSGATNQNEVCKDGSSTTVTIKNNGNTTITAYAFDNAYDYNDGSPEWNGNRSENKTKTVYIDRTAPTVSFTTTPSNNWSNVAPTATFTASDAAAGLYTVKTVWAPTTDSTTAFSTYSGSVQSHSASGNAFSSTAPKNEAVSGNIYLHVEVCDNAFSSGNTRTPGKNCTITHKGPFKYDITNKSTFTASANNVDWTHILKDLKFTATNDSLGNGRSGLATINLYFDNNYPHTNTNINNAKFNTNPNVSKTCETDKTKNTPTACSYAIDFASLKSDPVKSGEGGAVTEGVRYIKVEVVDLAGNKNYAVFGPYKWDTTKSKFESNLTPSGTPGKFYQE